MSAGPAVCTLSPFLKAPDLANFYPRIVFNNSAILHAANVHIRTRLAYCSMAIPAACREGRLVYQINGQGSLNGTLGSASCPSQQVLVGYSGVQICEGVSLLQVRIPTAKARCIMSFFACIAYAGLPMVEFYNLPF